MLTFTLVLIIGGLISFVIWAIVETNKREEELRKLDSDLFKFEEINSNIVKYKNNVIPIRSAGDASHRSVVSGACAGDDN